MKNLRGKVAVITGAAGGIGEQTAIALSQEGCHLALADVRTDALEEVATKLRRGGLPVSTHEVDVSDRDRLVSFVDEVIEAHGTVNILVNNAGVTVISNFEDQTLEDIDWIFGINLLGVVNGCKLFLPHLRAAGEGHIVNISSLFGIIAPPQQSTYCATKFAVRGFTESLHKELRSARIGVTSVHPGMIATNIVDAARVGTEKNDRLRRALGRVFERRGDPPSLVARKIVDAIKNDKPRVLVGREAYFGDAIKRLSPSLTSRAINLVFKG